MSEIREQNYFDLAASSKDAMVPFLGDQDWSNARSRSVMANSADTVSLHLPDASNLLTYQDSQVESAANRSLSGDRNVLSGQRGLRRIRAMQQNRLWLGLRAGWKQP